MSLEDEIRDKMLEQIRKDTDRLNDIMWSRSPLSKPPFYSGGIMHHLLHENDGYPIVNNGKLPELRNKNQPIKSDQNMEVVNEIIKRESEAFSARFTSLVIGRLSELGYETADQKAIAKRCTSIVKEGAKVREFWVDYGRDTARLIAHYTEPVAKIEEVDGVTTFSLEFTFNPISSDGA